MKGWTDPEIYEDKASGTKASRPALERLVKDMRQGLIERVVCFKLDRLGRSLTHLSVLLNEFKSLHVPLICTSSSGNLGGTAWLFCTRTFLILKCPRIILESYSRHTKELDGNLSWFVNSTLKDLKLMQTNSFSLTN